MAFIPIHIQKSKLTHDDLPFEKTLTIDNDVVFVKSVFNKIHNQYYYETFIKNVHINNL